MNRPYLCASIIKFILIDLTIGGAAFLLRPLTDLFFWIGLAAAILLAWLITLEAVLLLDVYANADE